jgi:hypothetical protein
LSWDMSERSTSEQAHAGTCGPILADRRHPLRRCPAAGATGRATQSGWSEPYLQCGAGNATLRQPEDLAQVSRFLRPRIASCGQDGALGSLPSNLLGLLGSRPRTNKVLRQFAARTSHRHRLRETTASPGASGAFKIVSNSGIAVTRNRLSPARTPQPTSINPISHPNSRVPAARRSRTPEFDTFLSTAIGVGSGGRDDSLPVATESALIAASRAPRTSVWDDVPGPGSWWCSTSCDRRGAVWLAPSSAK